MWDFVAEQQLKIINYNFRMNIQIINQVKIYEFT